jgi:hypothetical protein
MTGESWIFSYLAERRKVRPWLDNLVDTTTKTILEATGIDAQAVTTFTSYQESCFVHLMGQSFLVLDMNQIRVFHRMNCLFHSSEPDLKFSCLGIPLVVQRLRNMGLVQEAAAFLETLAESDRGYLRKIGLQASKHPLLLEILASQQYYITAHEAVHALATSKFNSQEGRNWYEPIRELCIRLLSFQYQFLVKSGDPHVARLSARYLRQVLASGNLQEELVADSLAQYLVLTYAPKHVNLSELVQAMVLAHCHLLSLGRINEYLRLFGLGNKLELGEDFLENNSIRLDWCVRSIDIFAQLIKLRPLADSHFSSFTRHNPAQSLNHVLLDNVQRMVSEHTRLFDEVVDEWLVESLQALQSGNTGNMPRNKNHRSRQVIDPLTFQVDEALGWNGTPVDLDSFLKQLL